MALAWPSAYPGVVTQRWGNVALVNEPAGYYDSQKAASATFAGAAFGAHVHRGLDIRAYEGTNLYAAERGEIIKAATFSNGELYMQLRINATTVLQYDHCSGFVAKVGDQVQRGQLIAKAGSTGNVTAAHLHFEVQITEGGRIFRYDPALFLAGGALAGDPRILPAGAGTDVKPQSDIPVAVCDVAAGTKVVDATTGAVVIASWAGGQGIGLYSIGGGNAALRLDLGAGGSDLRVCYVDPAKVSGVRLTGNAPVPGDCAAAVKAATDPLEAKIAAAVKVLS